MKTPRLMLVGEAYGAEEEAASAAARRPMPFVGAAGRTLNSMLSLSAIERKIGKDSRGRLKITQPDWLRISNVFNRRPPNANKVETLLVPRKAAAPGWDLFPWAKGKYLPPDLVPELDRLRAEIADFRPDIVVALGKTPLWALTTFTGIMERRGTLHSISIGKRTIPLIPTVHPAFVLRQYQWFVLGSIDIRRALHYARGTVKLEPLKYIDEPTLANIRELLASPGPITFDIETRPAYRGITCVGIGTSSHAVCVPFHHEAREGRNFWPGWKQEVEALKLVKKILENPKTTKIGHNVCYDLVWLREILGIEVAGEVRDTILMHRNLFPELPHALGQIAPNYRLYPPWKSDYKAGKDDA